MKTIREKAIEWIESKEFPEGKPDDVEFTPHEHLIETYIAGWNERESRPIEESDKPEYWGNIIYETAMGLYRTEEEAKNDAWMNEHYFPLFTEEQMSAAKLATEKKLNVENEELKKQLALASDVIQKLMTSDDLKPGEEFLSKLSQK